MKTAFRNFFRKTGRFFSMLTPSRRAMRWAANTLLIIALLILIASAWLMLGPVSPLEKMITILVFGVLAILTGLLLNLVLSLLINIHPWFRVALVVALMVVFMFFSVNTTFAFLAFLGLVLLASFIGWAIYYLTRRSPGSQPGKAKTFFRFLLLTLGLAGLAAALVWILLPGSFTEQPEIAALASPRTTHMLNTSNPAEKGPFGFSHFTYGSGDDKNREEYNNPDLVSHTVDGSELLPGWNGIGGKLRTRFFGFDASELPLNGMVWVPDGEGPFPLVLIVHGNHFAPDFSDPGYAYLGEHWASRGMMAVSVDENFLNGNHTDIFGGLGTENDARGWLLLEHLKLWEQWNQDPENQFFELVDMDNIALVGHSRGGEAVGHAALFNRLPHYPDNAKVVFDYDFNIKGIIAIAPSDGQYKPANVYTPLEDISYLSLQGSHDADVRSFDGARMFERLRLAPGSDHFGALVYIYGANHGQFNTRWGRTDYSYPQISLYNIGQLMSQKQQRQAGTFFMTAFLESVFELEPRYRKVFLDYRMAGEWLPETVYLTRYKDSSMEPVLDFSDDLDLTTAGIPFGNITTDNLTDWYEKRIIKKYSDLDARGVYLGWDLAQDSLPAEYSLVMEQPLQAGEVFYLVAADTGYEPSEEKEDQPADQDADQDPGSGETEEEEVDQSGEQQPDVGDGQEEEEKEPWERFIDFTIEMTDTQGECVRFYLSDFAYMQPMLEAELGKISLLNPTPLGESMLQLFAFPMNKMQEQNPWFDPRRLAQITLRFDRTSGGIIVIEEMGFTSGEWFSESSFITGNPEMDHKAFSAL